MRFNNAIPLFPAPAVCGCKHRGSVLATACQCKYTRLTIGYPSALALLISTTHFEEVFASRRWFICDICAMLQHPRYLNWYKRRHQAANSWTNTNIQFGCLIDVIQHSSCTGNGNGQRRWKGITRARGAQFKPLMTGFFSFSFASFLEISFRLKWIGGGELAT